MKVLIGAVVSALLVVSSAAAQTSAPTAPPAAPVPPSTCAPLPEPPALPDGATANQNAMQAGNVAVTAWNETYRVALACRRAEVEALTAQRLARFDEHNAAAAQLNTTIGNWQTEVTEFEARAGQRRVR